MHDGDYRSPEKITVADYLVGRWLPLRKRQIKASTWAGYSRNIELHIVPHIGRIPLQRLTADDLDGLYDHLLKNGRLNGGGGGLSPKTVRIIHAIMSKALADALRKGTVQRNVALAVDPPKPSRTAMMRVWTEAQLKQFLREISDHWLYPAYRLAAYTGMRRGEVLGVCWRDVDLDAGVLSVHRSVLNLGYEMRVDDVKTANSRRVIDLDPNTVAILRQWREGHERDAALLGRQLGDDEPVFARVDGVPTHPDYFSQVFERHLEKSELPRIKLHDLRHAHASIMLKHNVPVKVVSERLGHSSPAFTMTVYQHVMPGMQVDAARLFAAAIDDSDNDNGDAEREDGEKAVELDGDG